MDARLYTMAGSLGKGPVENEDRASRSFERFWNERPFDYGFKPLGNGLNGRPTDRGRGLSQSDCRGG